MTTPALCSARLFPQAMSAVLSRGIRQSSREPSDRGAVPHRSVDGSAETDAERGPRSALWSIVVAPAITFDHNAERGPRCDLRRRI